MAKKVQKTKSGKVDARTKEGKAIIERLKKAREAKNKKGFWKKIFG